ncbi:hypothetical protein [Allorhizocola rhizosphaerae]|uniref:hypothetical protein n=1 Tax=Allorhizocola rhizosphaerae TaxID=1872709 RepID=UPI000E3E618F|nr:hypothetical protein [Allorhizocola rhizosphaerae]
MLVSDADAATTRLRFKAAYNASVEVTFEPVGTTFALAPEDFIYLELPIGALPEVEVVVWQNGIGVWVPYPGDYVILDSNGNELDRL